jgi:general secretion pathway protein M
MKQWFQRLNRREQLIVLTVVAVVAGLMLYNLAWAPLKNGIERYEAANSRAQETVAWMRQAAADIKRTASTATGVSAPESISALVDTTLPKYQLLMQSYQPTGNDSAQLWLDDAALPEVLAWLAAMERDFGMRLVTVRIVSSGKQGFVKTRVKIAKP